MPARRRPGGERGGRQPQRDLPRGRRGRRWPWGKKPGGGSLVARPQIYRLALADLLHDRLVSFCQLALLVALFSPLLLLFSLKYGIVTTLLDDLASNPDTLQVKPIGAYHLGPDFFAALRAR